MLTKKVKRQILNWTKEAQNKIRLNNWELTVCFKPHSKDAIMDVAPDQEYLRATITVYEDRALEEMKSFGIEALEQAVYHELSHVLSNELYQAGKDRHTTPKELDDAWERLAESISRIIK